MSIKLIITKKYRSTAIISGGIVAPNSEPTIQRANGHVAPEKNVAINNKLAIALLDNFIINRANSKRYFNIFYYFINYNAKNYF